MIEREEGPTHRAWVYLVLMYALNPKRDRDSLGVFSHCLPEPLSGVSWTFVALLVLVRRSMGTRRIQISSVAKVHL